MTQARIALVLVAAAFVAALPDCSSSSPEPLVSADGGTDPEAAVPDGAGTPIDVRVHAVFDLPRTDATQALSATAFDPATRTLFALQDAEPRIVPIVASEDFRTWTPSAPIVLTGRTETAWDGEGLVRDDAGFIAVTVETAPTVERFDANGRFVEALSMPARFAEQAPGNKGLESLAISPSRRSLFTANESALTPDGPAPTKSRGTTVRILRRELAGGANAEYAYRTEPLGAGTGPGDMGVSDLAALSDDVLLVLERGFQTGYGNTVRIFRVDLAGAARVDSMAALGDAPPVVAKSLVVDLGTLPASGVTHPGTEPNPILDNYEALAIGPTVADGRRLLFVTSDDNASSTQVARVLVLSVAGM